MHNLGGTANILRPNTGRGVFLFKNYDKGGDYFDVVKDKCFRKNIKTI